MNRTRVIIMGAAGRDFHNFNVYFRDRQEYEVVAFTATQIPNIEGRLYPASLAGPLYPRGIPIHSESELVPLVHKHRIDQVVFAYSDVSHEFVMHRASQVLAAGADFRLMGTASTQIPSSKPVISICAVRTGSGKSQTTRRVATILRAMGLRVAAVRHPMPYGDLAAQAVQRFANYKDLAAHNCTIEEREEYEPHLAMGVIVYAGVDYERILRAAEQEVDVILWDGGNNDLPFFKSDLDYFVARNCRPVVRAFRFDGAEAARPAPGVLEALTRAEAILLAPSNPWVSLDPILAVPGIRELLGSKPVVGVSPIVGGRALKGPAAKMAAELGLPVSPRTIAAHFRSILAGFVLDAADAEQAEPIAGSGLRTLVTNTIMRDGASRAALASEMVGLAQALADEGSEP